MTTENTTWGADVQNGDANSHDGLSSETMQPSPNSSTDSLPRAMLRLTLALEEQNRALWSLVEQTATLVGIVAENQIDEDDEANGNTYLDGTRMS